MATRKGIDNTPSQEIIDNLTALCVNVLEPLREWFGKPLLITSGYRSVALNKAIGGSKTSQHCFGKAADFHINGMTVEEVYRGVKICGLDYDQAIQEFSQWTHISYSGAAKKENLRATKDENGHTVYTPD